MNHSFNIEVAKKVGTDCAILIENMAFWIIKNNANKKHLYDGYCWTYNSEKAFTELFPYWTRRQIQRILNNLEEKGIIKVGNYNKIGFDRTKWYTIIDNEILQIYNLQYQIVQCIEPNRAMEKQCIPDEKNIANTVDQSIEPNRSMDCTKPFNPLNQIVHPIPDINSDINPGIKSLMSEKFSDSTEMELAKYLFDKIKNNYNKVKEPNFKNWEKHIDYLIRLDKKTHEEIKKVINFATKDDFWKSNILSTEKLRKHFDKLWIKMTNNSNSTNNKKPIQSTNYEQREYDDDYFNSLYDNVTFVKQKEE